MAKFHIPVQIFGQPKTGRKTLLAMFSKDERFENPDPNLQISTSFYVLYETPSEQTFCVICVYDVTRRSSFEYIEYQLRGMADNKFKIVCLIGTHRDCKPRYVEYKDAIRLQDQYDGCWGEVGLHDCANFNTVANRLKIKMKFIVRYISENFSREYVEMQHNIKYCTENSEKTYKLQIIEQLRVSSPYSSASESAITDQQSEIAQVEGDQVQATRINFFNTSLSDYHGNSHTTEQSTNNGIDEFGNETLDLSALGLCQQNKSATVQFLDVSVAQKSVRNSMYKSVLQFMESSAYASKICSRHDTELVMSKMRITKDMLKYEKYLLSQVGKQTPYKVLGSESKTMDFIFKSPSLGSVPGLAQQDWTTYYHEPNRSGAEIAESYLFYKRGDIYIKDADAIEGVKAFMAQHGAQLKPTKNERHVYQQYTNTNARENSPHLLLDSSTVYDNLTLHTKYYYGRRKYYIFELKRTEPKVILEVVDKDRVFRIPVKADDNPYYLAKKAAQLFRLDFSKVGPLSELIIDYQSKLLSTQ